MGGEQEEKEWSFFFPFSFQTVLSLEILNLNQNQSLQPGEQAGDRLEKKSLLEEEFPGFFYFSSKVNDFHFKRPQLDLMRKSKLFFILYWTF